MSLVHRRLALSGLFSAIALIAHSTPSSGTDAEPAASPSVQEVQHFLLHFVPDRMAHYHVPGLSLACIHTGTVEWTQAFGVAFIYEVEFDFQTTPVTFEATQLLRLTLGQSHDEPTLALVAATIIDVR